MGKKSGGGGGGQMPSPSEYIPLVNAQASANRVNTYTPYGSTVFSAVPGSNANRGPSSSGSQASSYDSGRSSGSNGKKMGMALGAAVPGLMDSQGGGGSSGGPSGITPMQSVTKFSPALQRLFKQQTQLAGSPLSQENFNDEIEQATFKRAMNMLEPGLQQQTRDFQQSMADRGLPSGGAAYDNEYANIQRAQASARENAALSAVLAGNDAALRGRAVNLSERGQQFNELGSVLGQNQVTPTAPVDVMGPANMAMNGRIADQQAKQAKKSSGVNAGANLGAAAIMSDRRSKENINQIGEYIPGINIYEFNYKGKPGKNVGFMADEVEKIYPAAVHTRDDGMKMVDYGFMLGGRVLNG